MSLFPLGLISQGGGAGGANFELISTVIAAGTTTSVTFDVSSLSATYKHLQIRVNARADYYASDNWADTLMMRFNSDTGSNYSQHSLFAYYSGGNATASSGGANMTYMETLVYPTRFQTSNVFGGGIIDLLDVFSSTKYKTIRALGGNKNYASANSGDLINFRSGNWRNTTAVTSITLYDDRGVNFISGSRFSIYGVRG